MRKALLSLPNCLAGAKVYVISAAGGRPEQVTHGDEGDVSWAPQQRWFGTMGVGLQSPIRSLQTLDLTPRQLLRPKWEI